MRIEPVTRVQGAKMGFASVTRSGIHATEPLVSFTAFSSQNGFFPLLFSQVYVFTLRQLSQWMFRFVIFFTSSLHLEDAANCMTTYNTGHQHTFRVCACSFMTTNVAIVLFCLKLNFLFGLK